MVKELKDFLMKGNIVDLAVAVVIGAAFGAVVAGFVEFIINPLIAAVFGEPDLTNVLNITLREASADSPATILSIGGFLQTVLNFVIIGTVIFFVVKAYNNMQKPEEEEEAGPSDEVVLLTQIRDSLQRGSGTV